MVVGKRQVIISDLGLVGWDEGYLDAQFRCFPGGDDTNDNTNDLGAGLSVVPISILTPGPGICLAPL